MLTDDDPKTIVVHPRWHKYIYLTIGLIFAGFLYMVLDNLTDSVNAARKDLTSASTRADANALAVSTLADQVEGLGAVPEVTPSDLPKATAGERGATGPQGIAGLAGAIGLTGPPGASGSNGINGDDGADGVNGANGLDGAAGLNGVDGKNGTDGAQGATGPQGETGAQGPQGERGETGPQGPAGSQGEPGPTCPSGYVAVTRTLMTPQEPLGEDILVCVAQTDSRDSNASFILRKKNT